MVHQVCRRPFHICQDAINLGNFLSGEDQLIYERCDVNIVSLKNEFIKANFKAIKLLFPTAVLKIPFLSSLALKFPNKTFTRYLDN
jgi:hypothetical protein